MRRPQSAGWRRWEVKGKPRLLQPLRPEAKAKPCLDALVLAARAALPVEAAQELRVLRPSTSDYHEIYHTSYIDFEY